MSDILEPLLPLQSWYDAGSSREVEDQIIRALLNSRDLDEGFLSPRLTQIPDPELLPHLRASLELFWQVAQSGRKLLLVGDYDVDGVTSVALMLRFFRRMGLTNLDYFLPSRLRHGYGLTEAACDEVLAKEPALVITLDNGITARTEVQRLLDAGVQVIVTDHHEPQPELVPRCLCINPKLAESRFPDRDISGVGVAFLWLAGLRSYLRELGFWQGNEPNLLEHLDLVALGSIADQVPLLGVNRVFTRFGLSQMTQKMHEQDAGPGFYYLRAFADRLKVQVFDEQVLAFRLAPLLNAAGRMGDAGPALEFLLSTELTQARNALKDLERLNGQRRTRQEKMLTKAKTLALGQQEAGGLVLFDEEFHEGLSGVVAHRLLDEYGLPTAVFSPAGPGLIKASLRSREVNLMEILTQCDRHLNHWGGHANAAGCGMKLEALPAFVVQFQAACKLAMAGVPLQRVQADLEVLPRMMSFRLAELVAQMEPFGRGHRQPSFYLRGLTLFEPRVMAGKHLKWELDRDLEMIYWDGLGQLPPGSQHDLVVHLTRNQYLGRWKRQLVVQAVTGA